MASAAKKEKPQKPPPETWHTAVRQGAAEAIGHALFVFVAAGGATTTARFSTPGTTQIGIAISFGFTLTAFAFTFGHVSGAHLNPAVTIGRWAIRRLPTKKMFVYVLAQTVGAFIAAALLKALIPGQFTSAGSSNHCYASNMLSVDVTPAQGFFVEFVLTMFLLLVVGAAADSSKSNTTLVPLAIGLCVTGCHMIAIPITGTSVNPTRSLASALAATSKAGCEQVWKDHWIFWLAPILGGICGSFVYEYAFLLNKDGVNTLQAMYRDVTHKIMHTGPTTGAVELSDMYRKPGTRR